MQTYKAYKYRVVPTLEQTKKIEGTFAARRFVWNHFLERTTKAYKRRGERISMFDCFTTLTRMKEYKPWLKIYDITALRFAIKDLYEARDDFFRRVKQGEKPGYPKFKSKKNHEQSFTTDGVIYVDDECIKIPKIGRVRYRNRSGLGIKGEPVEATVSRTASGRYFISVCCKVEVEPIPAVDAQIGLDVGIKDFATDSNGLHYENPKYLAASLKKLARERRGLSRKVKGSINYEKQRLKIAKLHERIRNRRNTHHHQLSRKLVGENQVIVVEKLNIEGMKRNRKLSKAIGDAAWGEFIRQLEYKAYWSGRTLVKVPTFYPSSQTCSDCGFKNADVKNLRVRKWECPDCGATHDRDENAAKNILNKGREMLLAV